MTRQMHFKKRIRKIKRNIWNCINSPRSTVYIIGIFLLVSIIFSLIYYAVLPVFDGVASLRYMTGEPSSSHVSRYIDHLYYSITSQTKVGYGDIVPATRSGMIATMIQVTYGYFYIALVIAFFICKFLVKSDTFKSYFLPENNKFNTH